MSGLEKSIAEKFQHILEQNDWVAAASVQPPAPTPAAPAPPSIPSAPPAPHTAAPADRTVATIFSGGGTVFPTLPKVEGTSTAFWVVLACLLGLEALIVCRVVKSMGA